MTPRSQHHDPHGVPVTPHLVESASYPRGVRVPPPVEPPFPPSGVPVTPHPTRSLRHAHAEGDRFIPHAVTLQAHTPPHCRPQSQVLGPHALWPSRQNRGPHGPSAGSMHVLSGSRGSGKHSPSCINPFIVVRLDSEVANGGHNGGKALGQGPGASPSFGPYRHPSPYI